MNERLSTDFDNPGIRWVLVTGHRLGLALLVSLVFVVVSALSIRYGVVYVGPGSNLATVLSSGMLSGLLTLLTVALSINQLILSRLFGSVGELSDELDGALEYRRRVEEVVDVAVSPNEPSAFLTLLATTLQRRVLGFHREVERANVSPDTVDEVGEYASAVADYADHLSRATDLEDAYQVLLLTLGTDYADHIDTTREFRSKFGESISDESDQALDDVLELLKAVATMRQFFKTITLQQELAILSRQLIYTGIPAVLVTYFLAQSYTASPDVPPAIDPVFLPLVVTLSAGVIILPLAVLISSLLRVATVSLYTVSVGTFTPSRKSLERN